MTTDADQWWEAPVAVLPVDAQVALPGSKSMTNRALVLGALADGPSTIHHPLDARDTRLMAAALRALGSDIRPVHDAQASWGVSPGRLPGDVAIDCGLAGTVMRFVPPIAALAAGDVHFDGDPAARRRPVGPLLDALRQCGVRIDDGAARLPFTVHGCGSARGGAAAIDASRSSQFVSGLLLAAARFDQGLTVRNTGRVVPNRPHVSMTLRMLHQHGVAASATTSDGADSWRVEPGPITARDWTIEPDLSNATPFMAAALATAGAVRFEGLGRASVQAVEPVTALIEALGGSVTVTDGSLEVAGGDVIVGGELDLRDLGELTPTVVALALMAESPTRIVGIDYLRGHETDRLAALAAESGRLGGDVSVTDDGLLVRPRPLHGGAWHTYDDHRMATAGAIVGLRVAGVTVQNIASTKKTFPGFAGLWRTMVDVAAA